MKISLTILLVFLTSVITCFGQITTTKVVPKIEQNDSTPYDNTKNFLGENVRQYIGQELYLNGKSESSRKYGYDGFLIDYRNTSSLDKSNVYKCCDSFNSRYNDLVGRYFVVLDVIKHPKAAESEYLYGKVSFLKLQEKESKNVLFFKYDSQFEHTFPFIVVGYFNRLKQDQIGRSYILRGKNWISSEPMADIKTGKPVSNFVAGAKWKVVDVSVEEKYYSLSLILENEKGEQIPLGVDRTGDYYIFAVESVKAEQFRKEFGDENWQRILEGKIKIGMTKMMCELSWGKPKKVNETISAGKKTEQWIYEDNYLYFDNGVLVTMQ